MADLEFKSFEKEVVGILARKLFSSDELAEIFANGEVSFEDNHDAGYFIQVKHSAIPESRIVLHEPTVMGELGDCIVGFVIFIERHELAIDVHDWGATGVPPNFRDEVIKLRVGRRENGQLIED